jgi:hypothetical protein
MMLASKRHARSSAWRSYPPIGNQGISESNIAAARTKRKDRAVGIARVPGPDFGRRHLRSVGTISRGTDGPADIGAWTHVSGIIRALAKSA